MNKKIIPSKDILTAVNGLGQVITVIAINTVGELYLYAL